MARELTLNDWLFIGEYVKDWSATDAVRRAGFYHGIYPSNEASRRLRKANVIKEVERLRAEMAEKVQLSTSIVTQDIMDVLTADPRDLVEIVAKSCRYCHGYNHMYQRTQNEYLGDEFKANATAKPFESQGGMGFNPHRDPHPDCPECFGRGIMVEELKDVRFLSRAAAAIYMGGERTKHGLKINLRSKDAARDAAAKWLGMNKETVTVLDGKKMADMTDDELEAMARGFDK